MSKQQKHVSYNHERDYNLPEISTKRNEIKVEINANKVKPSELERSTKSEVRQAKKDYKSQNKMSSGFISGRLENVELVVKAERSNQVKFNAKFSELK